MGNAIRPLSYGMIGRSCNLKLKSPQVNELVVQPVLVRACINCVIDGTAIAVF